jgi:plastocyanin
VSIKQKTRGLVLAIAGSLALTAMGAGPILAQSPEVDPNLIPMQANLFLPPEKIVVAGTTLTWVNLDAEEHDVLANDLSFMSPLIKTGETWSYTFDAPGTYSYVCDLHVNMEGVVVVTPAA